MNMHVSLITLAVFSWHSIPKQNNMHVSPIKKRSVRLRLECIRRLLLNASKRPMKIAGNLTLRLRLTALRVISLDFLVFEACLNPATREEGIKTKSTYLILIIVVGHKTNNWEDGVVLILPLYIRITVPIKKNIFFSPQTEFLAVLIFNMLSLCALLFYNMQRTSQGVALAIERATHARFLRVHIFRKKQLKRHRFRDISEAHPLFISPCQGETRTHTECVRRRGHFQQVQKYKLKTQHWYHCMILKLSSIVIIKLLKRPMKIAGNLTLRRSAYSPSGHQP